MEGHNPLPGTVPYVLYVVSVLFTCRRTESTPAPFRWCREAVLRMGNGQHHAPRSTTG